MSGSTDEITVDSRKTRRKKGLESDKIRRYLDSVVRDKAISGGWKGLLREQAKIAKNESHPKQLDAIKDILDRRFGKAPQAISIDPAANKVVLELQVFKHETKKNK